MNISNKNIYYQGKKQIKDSLVKESIENTFNTHPAYGHRRLAIELSMNKKKILRIMHKFDLKPPRLWYQKKFLTKPNPAFKVSYTNLLENINHTYDTSAISLKCQYLKKPASLRLLDEDCNNTNNFLCNDPEKSTSNTCGKKSNMI